MDSMTWAVFDIMGTVAFAVSGAMVGIEKRMDIFGIIVLALLTAVGGGMVRDVLCGITPPSVLRSPNGLFVSIITALIISFLYYFLVGRNICISNDCYWYLHIGWILS